MKTLIITTMLALASFAATAEHDSQPKKNNRHYAKREVNAVVANKVMQHAVQKQLFFPNNGSSSFEGQADVFFQVHPDGEVKLLRISASTPELEAFVRSQASNFKVDPTSFRIGEVFRYRFNFKREA